MTLRDFSPRDRRIIRLVAAGRKNAEIGQALGISTYVTKNYLQSIYERLGFSNRVELALWYIARKEESCTPRK